MGTTFSQIKSFILNGTSPAPAITNPAPVQTTTSQGPAQARPRTQTLLQKAPPSPQKSFRTNSKKPRKAKSSISPEAKKILRSLPGSNQTTFLSTFYKAHEVTSSDDVYADILKYVKNGQVHKSFKVKVNKILRIVRNGDMEFEHCGKLNERFRLMLWHGTKLAKIAPILETGFQLPTPTGQMFGPGIYFADRISKSCNYCDGTAPGAKAYLFLCDVLVGLMYNAKAAHNKLTQAPAGFKKNFDSVMCTGQFVPDRTENISLKGSIIPAGKTISNTKFSTYSVQYNEYIVYDTSKIKIKYLVQVEFS